MTKYRDEYEEQPPTPPPSTKITPSSVLRQNLNPYPESDVEAQSLLIAPQTGRAKIGKDLDDIYKIKHSDDRKGSAWDYFTAQTSDTRLSNIRTDPEMRIVRWAIGQQGRCLMMGLGKSAANADWWRSQICEPSLGRNGFLRENLQSIHTKSESINVENVEKGRNVLGFLKSNK